MTLFGKKIRRNGFSKVIVFALTIALMVTACVYIDNISVTQIINGKECDYALAGEDATFTITGHIECASNVSNTKFVAAILAPKSWNVAKYAKVTYKCDLAEDRNQLMTMSLMPSSSLPKNANGLTWVEALSQTFGVGPNVLDDMEWVVFQTDQAWDIYNGDRPTYNIFITTRMGNENLKCKLGFFVNHTDDGFSGGMDHKKVMYSDAFEVKGGTGELIDYCNRHFNKISPMLSLQNDFITFSFIGSSADNELTANNEPVYLEAYAYGVSGAEYSVTEKSPLTLMKIEDDRTNTNSITIWPAGFFNIPDDEQLLQIKYFFTNKDRTIVIGQSDDDFAQLGKDLPQERQPFVYTFTCN